MEFFTLFTPKQIEAFEHSQKYKEGKYILERYVEIEIGKLQLIGTMTSVRQREVGRGVFPATRRARGH